MPHYLLTVVQPGDGTPPPPEVLEPIMRDTDAVHRAMVDAGCWVFGGGLHPPAAATTLRPRNGDVLVVDGPFAEAKEHVGGFSVIDVPDLDAALEWGRKAAAAVTLPIEVRPLAH